MLILSGRIGDKIKIGDDVEIIFLGGAYNRGQYRIGFNAPIKTKILRDKAKLKIKRIEK